MIDTDKPNVKKRTSNSANCCADGIVPHFRAIKNRGYSIAIKIENRV
jgi:hypothetical protein